MASNGGVVLVVGDGVAADRARARLEEAGQQVLRAPWSRSHFTEVEKGPGPVAVGDCDVLIAFPPAADSESRWPGLLDRVRSRGVVVLAGSMPPRDVAALADVVAARGFAFLDAPTAAHGGVIPVGATEAELEGARPLLETLGTPILQGAAGTGQQARLCGEIALGATMIGLCEALAYARAAGLEPQRVLEVLGMNDQDEEKSRVLGKILACYGGFCFSLNLADKARKLLEESLAILRRHHALAETGYALLRLSEVAMFLESDPLGAQAYLQESLTICREVGYRWGIARKEELLRREKVEA